MAKLNAAARKKIPKSEFGEPGERKYPINDKAHAMNAKSRATQQWVAGKLSSSSREKINEKANKFLKKGHR